MTSISFLRAALEEPSRVALVAEGRAFTYGELGERIARVASALEKTERPRHVAFVPHLDVATFCLIHALVERGITAIPIHPRLTDEERSALLADAKPDRVVDDIAALETESEGPAAPSGPIDESSCLAILHTSGTTGRPKGVMLARRAFRASAEASAANLGWRDDDRWLLCMPLAHVGGLSILLRSLLARRCVVFPDAERFEPSAIRRVMDRDRVTIASLVPTQLSRMLTESATPLPPSVRVVLLGGAATPAPLLDAARALAIPALTTYGLTEACSQVTTQRHGTPPGIEQGSGITLGATEVRIVDERIHVRGPSLLSGYHGGSEAPLDPDGWFVTEDFGRIDDEGRLHVLGRRQELLVTGGENVYPLEVERTIETLPHVRAACVFGVPDETWGEIVCAALVLEHDDGSTLRAITDAFATKLAPHKRPRRVVVLEALATTAAGKLDRAATRALALLRIQTPSR